MVARDRVLLAAVLVAAIGFLATGPGSAAAPGFDPGGIMCFEALESSAECDGNTAAGEATDIRLRFCTSWNEDCTIPDGVPAGSLAAGMVMFTPPEWNLPKGDTIPIGAITGRVVEELHQSVLNNPCNNRMSVSGTLLNASINVSDTIAARPEGTFNIMQPLAMDADGNGIPDGADRYPAFLAEHFQIDGNIIQPRARLFAATNVLGIWITENILFFEPGTTLEVGQTRITFNPALGFPAVAVLQHPTAHALRLAITEFCAPTLFDLVVLGKTLDNPCTPAAVQGSNCPVTADVAPEFMELGYPSFPCDTRSSVDDDGDGVINDGCPQVNDVAETGAECNNDTSDDFEDSHVNDGCPQAGEVSEGARIPGDCTAVDEGGCTYRSNPGGPGTRTFTVGAVSGWDADGDGIDNGLDVCFDKPNPEWNAWGPDPVNDSDNDGLPNVCDLAPDVAAPGSPVGCASGYTGSDFDQDCYSNRRDNCPTTNQLENPTQPPGLANLPLQTDSDGDRIGDACDPEPNLVNGEHVGYCLTFALEVGGVGGSVVGVKDAVPVPDCASASQIYLSCNVTSSAGFVWGGFFSIPVIRESTDIEVTTADSSSGWSVYFAERPGLGHLSADRATMLAGKASVKYIVPSDLDESGYDTISAAVFPISSPFGMSDVIVPGICSIDLKVEAETQAGTQVKPVALPPTGGSAAGHRGVAAVALAGAIIALVGAGVIGFARRRRA